MDRDCVITNRASKIMNAKSGVLRRILRHVGGQMFVLAFLLLDIGSLGFAFVAPGWLAAWAIINLTMLLLGLWRWSEDGRLWSEIRAAMQQQAERLDQAEQKLIEAEACRRGVEEVCDAQRKERANQAQRLQLIEQQLRESERLLRLAEGEREAQRQEHVEQSERLRLVEQQLKEAQRKQKNNQKREAQRDCHGDRKQAAMHFTRDWWIVLGVAPSTRKEEIARNFRRRIKQYHPDRVAGLAPEFLQIAEEHTKELNQAYANAMRTRQ